MWKEILKLSPLSPNSNQRWLRWRWTDVDSILAVTSTLPAFSAIVLYTKLVSKQFDSLVSQAATGLFCHVSHSEAGERKGSSPSTMSFDLCRPVRHRQVHITLSSERWANPSVTRERERKQEKEREQTETKGRG